MSKLGISRSSVHKNHALITKESYVYLHFPAWKNISLVYLISKEMGAKFYQFIGFFDKNGNVTLNSGIFEYFFYVLKGDLNFELGGKKQKIVSGDFSFIAPNTDFHLDSISEKAEILFFKKEYQVQKGIDFPASFISCDNAVKAEAFLGDPTALLKCLIPDDEKFDMAINIFSFAPGGTLPMVETHYMEHGLYLFQGEGVYRLGEHWYNVIAGDTIWMSPFLLQWYAATGKEDSRYIYYKEANRDPIV